jgi:hypothetical protein
MVTSATIEPNRANGPPLPMIHWDWGASVSVRLAGDAGYELASPREIAPRPGPSARRRRRS